MGDVSINPKITQGGHVDCTGNTDTQESQKEGSASYFPASQIDTRRVHCENPDVVKASGIGVMAEVIAENRDAIECNGCTKCDDDMDGRIIEGMRCAHPVLPWSITTIQELASQMYSGRDLVCQECLRCQCLSERRMTEYPCNIHASCQHEDCVVRPVCAEIHEMAVFAQAIS